jgi:hypothetical protein
MPSPAATAVLDQAHAAADHARAVLDQLAELTGHPHTTPDRPSPWLAAQLRALVHQLTHRTATYCPHVARTPQIVHAVAWRPGVIACTTCARAMLQPTPTEDRTCDRCRHIGYPIHSALVVIGPLIYGYGLCDPCANAAEHPTAPGRQPADG